MSVPFYKPNLSESTPRIVKTEQMFGFYLWKSGEFSTGVQKVGEMKAVGTGEMKAVGTGMLTDWKAYAKIRAERSITHNN